MKYLHVGWWAGKMAQGDRSLASLPCFFQKSHLKNLKTILQSTAEGKLRDVFPGGANKKVSWRGEGPRNPAAGCPGREVYRRPSLR